MLFLFHAKEDGKTAHKIMEKLPFKDDDISVWVENENFNPSPERAAAMKFAIERADFHLLLFSEHSYTPRGDLLREYDFTLTAIKQLAGSRQSLIPIRIDDCFLPAQLQNFHFYNLFEEGGLEHVARFVQPDPDQQKSEDPSKPANFFYKNNWEWIIQYNGVEMIGDHKYESGFTYLHFILATKLNMISINSLKKVTTRLHQPERYTLLGLTEDGDDERERPEGHKDKDERRDDILLFKKIRDEIIYAIQSIPEPEIRQYFLRSIKFYSDHYVFYNRYWTGETVHWKLYLPE